MKYINHKIIKNFVCESITKKNIIIVDLIQNHAHFCDAILNGGLTPTTWPHRIKIQW